MNSLAVRKWGQKKSLALYKKKRNLWCTPTAANSHAQTPVPARTSNVGTLSAYRDRCCGGGEGAAASRGATPCGRAVLRWRHASDILMRCYSHHPVPCAAMR